MCKQHRIYCEESAEFSLLLASHKLTSDSMRRALNVYQGRGNGPVRIGIGLSELGFHYSPNPEWTPELDDEVIIVPWVQLYEALGLAPAGTMSDFLAAGATFH